jgi:hypothetical protein
MKTMNTVVVSVLWMATAAAATGFAATAHADNNYLFLPPSETIGCAMENDDRDGTAYAVCRIQDAAWVAPPSGVCQLASIPGAIGQPGSDLQLRQGNAPCLGAHMRQLPDPRLGNFPTLDYGQKHSIGSLTCDSEPSGITCTDSSTGHFFRLSRESYQLG